MISATAYRDFWSVAGHEVEQKTGAIMDCADIREVLTSLDLDLSSRRVLDVGCGTGRVSQLCDSYVGTDVSPAMVAYCHERGLTCYLTTSPLDLRELETKWGVHPFSIVTCLSVFTHIAQADRQSYLASFRHMAPELLVDILPGAAGGTIAAWYAEPAEFELDLNDAGWTDIVSSHERVSADGETHLYYLAR